jgi:hypothetical protein
MLSIGWGVPGGREEHEVLQKAELSCEADSENYLGGSSETMYYIGLDVHKRRVDGSYDGTPAEGSSG